MDGVGSTQGGVLVLGATNVPWELDPAMRRRFEKRVYIALPEAPARSTMFKLNIGDTPNDITDDQFLEMGVIAEGYSGSDVAVVVREAIMEPLRKCQQAKQFMINPQDGMIAPCSDYPNCPYCPMNLLTQKTGTVFTAAEQAQNQCQKCGAIRMSLYDIDTDKLSVPVVVFPDFVKALNKAHGSVATSELLQCVQWTEEFGQEG